MRKMPSAWWPVALVMLALTGSQCRADEITIVRGEPYAVSAAVLVRDGAQWRAASNQ
jgi:hypothetical protein